MKVKHYDKRIEIELKNEAWFYLLMIAFGLIPIILNYPNIPWFIYTLLIPISVFGLYKFIKEKDITPKIVVDFNKDSIQFGKHKVEISDINKIILGINYGNETATFPLDIYLKNHTKVRIPLYSENEEIFRILKIYLPTDIYFSSFAD